MGLEIEELAAQPLGLDPVLQPELAAGLLVKVIQLGPPLFSGLAFGEGMTRLRQQRRDVLVAGLEALEFLKVLLRLLRLAGLQPLCAPPVQVGQLRPALLGGLALSLKPLHTC